MKPVRARRRYLITCSTLAIIALLASACSGRSAPSANQPSGSNSTAQKLVVDTPPAAGQIGTVTWDEWEGEPTTIDPFHSADYTPNTINSNMCENLIALKPNFSFGPNLATSWKYTTPHSLVLQIRKGVTFWDGSPMTADDVAFSLNRNLTDKTTFYNYLFSHVASVEKTGAYEVTIKLSQPDYLLVNELADYAGVIVSKKFFEAHPKTFGSPSVGVMCTGPFKFQSWSKGDNITLARYDGYWDKTRMPKVATLIFKFLTDESSITSALLSGQIDGAYDPPLSGINQLAAAKNVGKLYYGPHLSDMTFTYSNPSGAMANPLLRKALQRAIDWNGIATTVLKGTGEPIKALLPPTVFTYAKSDLEAAYAKLAPVTSADYAGAKKLVAQAGADAKKKIVMALPATFTAQQYCNAIADAARRIGLKLQLKVVPVDTYTNYLYDAKTRAGVDMLWTDFWPNTPDPLDYLGIAAVSGGSFNQYQYSGIDKLYNQAQATEDPTARAKLVAQMMQKTSSELLPMVPGISHSARLWMNNRITGAPASFDYVYYPWAATLGAAK
jgi:peptide/nickel transport system substrate-binding protein